MRVNLRRALSVSLIAVSIIPLFVAGWFGIKGYTDSLEEQATGSLTADAQAATSRLQTRAGELGEDLEEELDLSSIPALQSGDAAAVAPVLSDLADRLGVSRVLFVERDGAVLSSDGESSYQTSWSLLKDLAISPSDSGIGVIPEEELGQLGLSARSARSLADEDSPADESPSGALALLATSPIRSPDGERAGTLVALEVINRSNRLVDEIASDYGVVCAIYQEDVMVASSLEESRGHRLLGVEADPATAGTVLDNATATGRTTLLGDEYLFAFSPLADTDGRTVGMLGVFTSRAPLIAAGSRFATTFTAILVVTLALTFGVSFFIARHIWLPLKAVAETAERTAGGDLRTEVPEKGYEEAKDLARLFNEMTVSLKSIIASSRGAVEDLANIAAEVREAAQTSASGAAETAATISQVTRTTEFIARAFSEVAEEAERVARSAEGTLAAAESGRTMLEESDSGIRSMADGARQTAEAAEQLAEASREIASMTTLITNISEQTKILALNAAIEAARAGAAGQGFTVVASEIRALAESVAQSATGIVGVVKRVEEAGEALARAAAEQLERVEAGVSHSASARDSFDDILSLMSATADQVRNIKSMAARQQGAIGELSAAMQQVSAAASDTAAAAQQLAGAAEQIDGEARRLKEDLGAFRTE
ncbi:MAG: hypothetical protein Kow0056_16470 [Coriobacteriia bacterium]